MSVLMNELDNIDRQLIGLLREDARRSVSALAEEIGVSRATIVNRIKRLEGKQIITGYTALIGSGVDDKLNGVRAHMCASLNGCSVASIQSKLLSEPSVSAIHTTNGRWDVIIELQSPDLASFDKALGRLRAIKDITQSETSILLSSYRSKSTVL